MSRVKNLQVKRLLKELEYIESDFEYRNEVVSEADDDFIRNVNEFLKNHPDIKEVYDKKITEKINKSIDKKIEDSENESRTVNVSNTEDNQNEEKKDQENEEDSRDVKHNKIKKTYREIVKLTHPDITKNKKNNDLYITATKYYDQQDQIGLYKVCDKLNIEYEIDDKDEQSISDKISNLKVRIDFLEKTLTWKWHNTTDEVEKNQILINYIKLRIS